MVNSERSVGIVLFAFFALAALFVFSSMQANFNFQVTEGTQTFIHSYPYGSWDNNGTHTDTVDVSGNLTLTYDSDSGYFESDKYNAGNIRLSTVNVNTSFLDSADNASIRLEIYNNDTITDWQTFDLQSGTTTEYLNLSEGTDYKFVINLDNA